MEPSLSVIVPVRNVERTLAGKVETLLEVLPDLTADFEIVIVDDGSQDQTEEVVCDLVCRYPQVRSTRMAEAQGFTAASATGLDLARGDFVMIQDGNRRVRAGELRRLWNLREDDELVIARSVEPAEATLLERLMEWGTELQRVAADGEYASVQMIRRNAVEELLQEHHVPPPASRRRAPIVLSSHAAITD